jgi:hypothetical protein
MPRTQLEPDALSDDTTADRKKSAYESGRLKNIVAKFRSPRLNNVVASAVRGYVTGSRSWCPTAHAATKLT